MNYLDSTGMERLHDRQQRFGDTYYRDVPPQKAQDDDKQISVTLDAAGRVAGVTIDDFARLRESEATFARALEQAYEAADGMRAMVSAELSPRRDELVARAHAVLNGTYEWRGITADNSMPSTATTGSASWTSEPARGHSANGYLSVEVSGGSIPKLRINLDQTWLWSATAQSVENALREALIEAGEWAS